MRLYTAGDHLARPAFETPEIARLDLSETVLELAQHGVTDPAAFEWLDAPPRASLDAAVELLSRLGAVTGPPGRLELTRVGQRMLAFPVHPRQSRLLVHAESRGVSRDACGIAAIIGERPFTDTPVGSGFERSDLTALLADLEGRGRHDPARVAPVRRVQKQLERIARDAVRGPDDELERERALLEGVLLGYPDRVGRLRRPDRLRASTEVVFASGGSANLAEQSRARDTDLLVAVDVEERVEGGRTRVVVRLASAIEQDWLLEHFTDAVTDEETLAVAEGSGKVDAVRTLRYGQLVLDEQRVRTTDPEKVGRAIAGALLAKGLSPEQLEGLERVAVRIELARKHAPDAGIPALDTSDVRGLCERACVGIGTLDEARSLDLGEAALAALPPRAAATLNELLPARVALPGGRKVEVHYERSAPPWILSRLQDFFGMTEGPRILAGRVPLVLHLAAPNGRAVQLTTDLAGFWDRHYPAIAKELRRKYPRHAWPDDPRTASPPPLTIRRQR